jgi:hypothetical protein
VQLELLQPVGDLDVGTGQEAGPHPVSNGSEAQIEACRLDLAVDRWLCGRDFAGCEHRLMIRSGKIPLAARVRAVRSRPGPLIRSSRSPAIVV